jgi:ABC-2 type transport system permease protein
MLRAELIKITTIKGAFIAAIVAALGVAFTQLATGWLVPSLASLDPEIEAAVGEQAVATPELQLASLNLLGGAGAGGSVGIALIAVLLLGATVATADTRHGGIVTTALAEPRRGRIVRAKALAALIAAGVTAVAAAAVLLGLVMISPDVLEAGGFGVSWAAAAEVLGRGILTLAVLGVLGAAIGVIIGGQTATFLILIAGAFADVIVRGLFSLAPALSEWGAYLPVALATAAAGPVGQGPVPPVLALGILATLALGASAVAWAVLRRRDL